MGNFISYFLPYRQQTFITPLSEEQIDALIRKHTSISASLYYGAGRSEKSFHGVITAGGYKLRREITYRNSFLPTIGLQVAKTANGSSVAIRMWMPLLVLVVVTGVFLVFTTTGFQTERVLLIPGLGFPAAAIAIFQVEAGIALRALKKLLQLEEIPKTGS